MATGIETYDKPDSSTLGPIYTHAKVIGAWEIVGRGARPASPGDVGGNDDETILFNIGTTDVWARSRFVFNSSANVNAPGVWLRGDPSVGTGIECMIVEFSDGHSACQIYEEVNGAQGPPLASVTGPTVTDGQEYIIEGRVTGTAVDMYVDAVLMCSATTAITSGSRVGVSGWRAGSGDDCRADWITFGAIGETFDSPYIYAERGSVTNTSGETSTPLNLTNPTKIQANSYLVLAVSADNSVVGGTAPTLTITDPRSNTWTVLPPALANPGSVANGGQAAWIAYAKRTTAYQATDALTLNWSTSTTAKAAVCYEVANVDISDPIAVSAVTANGASGTPSVSITPTAEGQMVFAVLGTECGTADSYTEDADTTNGPWNIMTRTGSGTTTSGSTVVSAYKMVTAAGAQSWDPTITSRDWAQIAVVFEMNGRRTNKVASGGNIKVGGA